MDRFAHRQSACKLTFLDAQGKPMQGRRVHARLTRHEFKFGCNIFWLTGLFDPRLPADKQAQLYRMWEDWSALFNFGTLPFYQGQYEPQEGVTREAILLKTAQFLRKHNVEMKGHPLCWHTVSAKWLLKKTNDEVLENQLHRIRREVSAFKDYIHMWDVINEVVIMPDFTAEENAITRLCAHMGRVELVKAAFDMARQTDPNATLLLNDFVTSDRYKELITDCLSAGVDIDVIGIQSHQHQGFWGQEKLQEVLSRFETFGKPIHFTENTFVSGDLIPPHIVDLNDWQVPEWPTTPEGEDRQARDFLAMLNELFAHPQVEAFSNWDFCDGAWLGAPAGLVRLDGSHKPAYDALKQRIWQDWCTDVTLMTDENGQCTLEGFRGEYALQVDNQEASMTLDKATISQTIHL
ncbi:MAG: endo-1,4-beta-xylanase [Clostridiales bacterium]|nr:endo-1,4-beta-xylanase [Clostridiales bacterium]